MYVDVRCVCVCGEVCVPCAVHAGVLVSSCVPMKHKSVVVCVNYPTQWARERMVGGEGGI